MAVKTLADATYGTILVTGNGLALYHYTKDSTARSACTGACTQTWLALLLPTGARLVVAPGVREVATFLRADGQRQVMVDGHPLYTFAGATAGQTSGQGTEGTWFLMIVTTATAPPSTTPVNADTNPTRTPTSAGARSMPPAAALATTRAAQPTTATHAPSQRPAPPAPTTTARPARSPTASSTPAGGGGYGY